MCQNQHRVAATSATATTVCTTDKPCDTALLIDRAAACAGLVVSKLSGSTVAPVMLRPAVCIAARRIGSAVGSASAPETTAAAAALGVATANCTVSAVVSRWRRPVAWSANETMVMDAAGTFS